MKRSKKILLYKLCCVVFAAVLLFVPQQGTPYSDIRVLATVLGVDGGDGNVTVAAQLAIPVAQGSDGKASTVAKATGGSLGEALENLEIGLGRRVDYGHLSTVAIGKEMLLSDLQTFTGYLLSSGKAGPGTYLVYCADSTASDFLDEAQGLGESSDAELSNFISYNKNGNHVSTTTLLRFLQSLHSVSHATYMPCVAIEDENAQSEAKGAGSGDETKSLEQLNTNDRSKEKAPSGNKEETSDKNADSESDTESKQSEKKQSGQKQQGNDGQQGGQEDSQSGGQNGQSGSQSGGGKEKKKLAAANTVVVYGGDADEAVELDALATRGVVWQDAHSDFGLVELRNVQLDGTDIPAISARLTGKKVTTKADRIQGENVFTYRVRIKLRLDDSKICSNPLFYNQWKNVLEQMFESVIQNNIMQTVAVSKELNADFLGIREYFHKFCRKGFNAFDLQTVVVKVNADVTIQT